jgi:plasmid stabilization system protein ParE
VRLELSSEADADLDDIVKYTLATHGLKQAREYAGGLTAFLDELARDPRGQTVEGVEPPLLRPRYRYHFIFFRVGGGAVAISRIMHVHRDFRRYVS